MKTVGKMKRAIIALAVTLCFAVVSCGVLLGTVRAHAADKKMFGYGGLENRTYIAGITKNEVVKAFDDAATRLAETFAEQEIDCKLFSRGGTDDPLGQNWPDDSKVKGIIFGQAYCSETHSHGLESGAWGVGVIVAFNPHTKEAYTIRGGRSNLYAGDGNTAVIRMGYPKGEEYTVNDTVYQNFSLGYVSGSTWHEGKQVDENGVESALTADDIAESMFIDVWQDVNQETAEFKALTVSDYVNAYKAYYADKDINAKAMTLQKGTSTMWRQTVADSEGNKTGEVVFNETRKQMFTVTNTFLSSYNSTTDWGAPVAEERTVTNATTQKDVVSQQFANGVAVLTEKEDETTEIVFHKAMKVDENGEIVSVIGADSVGAIADELISKLPQGVTAEAVKAAVQAKYDSAMGVPAQYMEFAEGTNILVQRFVSNGGGTSEISLDVSAQTLTAVLLSAETYELYEKPTRFNEGNKKYDVTGEMILGPAITDAFAVGEKTYQNFLYGAIELTADEDDAVFPGVNYKADGTRTVLDLSAKIVIEDDVFIPNSYGNVGAADLLEKFQAAYKEYVQKGVALGMPNKEGIGAWSSVEGGIDVETGEFKDGQGMIKLGLHMTDSNAICYYGVTAMLAYSPEDGKVYILKDAVISNMANYYSVYGAPRGDLTKAVLTVDGEEYEVEIQNFQLGYLTVMGGSASMTADRNWDFELKGAVNLDGSRIPGVEYPGDKKPDEKPDDNEVEAGCGCGGDLTADGALFGGVAAVVTLGAAAAIVLAKKRKEDR